MPYSGIKHQTVADGKCIATTTAMELILQQLRNGYVMEPTMVRLHKLILRPAHIGSSGLWIGKTDGTTMLFAGGVRLMLRLTMIYVLLRRKTL